MPGQTIIVDTSCLIVLTSIDELNLLKKLYGSVVVTKEIANEFGSQLPDWIRILKAPENFSKAITVTIGKGEASAIALALEFQNDCLLIIDDLRARKYAKKVGLNVIGTIGMIALAEERGIVERGMMLIKKIQRTNFRLSDEIVARIKKLLK